MINIGDIIGDRYEIIEKIGSGGMSDVYKAICHKLNRYVAIKVLKQEFCENDEFVYKFRVEAQAAAGLAHPNIVSVYDVGDEADIHYIVMEWIDGFTLKKYIEKKQRLTIKETTSIAIEVSRAIAAAHNSGIIHRDIKPQNIMISKDGKVKITDFGIAKATTSNTITGNVMGSVHYVSPEQARGGYSDAKSDIYSLGITLFEMITGRLPFNGDTTVAVAIKHIQDPFPNPTDFVPDLPRVICDIILKCTQKNQDKRYLTMSELAEDLKRSMTDPDGDFVEVVDETSFDTKAAPPRERARTQAYATERPPQPVRRDRVRPSHDVYADEVEEEYIPLKTKKAGHTNKPNKSKRPPAKKQKQRPKQSGKRKTRNEDAGMDKLMTVLTVVAAVLIAGITFFIIGKVIGLFGIERQANPEAAVTMPNVTGQAAEAAKKALNDLKIQYEIDYELSDDVKRDIVISQSIDEGEPVNAEDTVVLTVSQGTDGIEIPDVSGLTKAEARIALEDKGFNVLSDEVFAEDVAKGLVVYQKPEAKTMAKRGEDVTIYLSQGERGIKVEVPNLVGKTETQAKAEIERAGFVCEVVKEEFNDKYTQGLVFKQVPEAATTLPEGSGIAIYLSLGVESSPLPSDITQTYACEETVEEPLDYQGGAAVVKLVSGGGTVLYNSTVSAFPVAVNVRGITDSATGSITVDYEVTVNVDTIDESGHAVTVPHTEPRTLSKPVTFKEER